MFLVLTFLARMFTIYPAVVFTPVLVIAIVLCIVTIRYPRTLYYIIRFLHMVPNKINIRTVRAIFGLILIAIPMVIPITIPITIPLTIAK